MIDLGLKDRIVLVTGSGGGIGRSIAQAFAKMGSKVVVSDILYDTAKETFDSLEGNGHSLFIKDISNVDECISLINETVERYGRLDVLVNVAAVLKRMPIEEVDEAIWDLQFNVNVKSQFFLGREAACHMEKNNWGRIINFSSQGGHTGGFLSSTVYATTKGGILALTKSFARAYAPNGITVNAVAPGGVNTQMMKLPEEQINSFIAQIPIGRLAEVDEVAMGVLFLASDWAGYITGVCLDVTGGQLMR